MTSNPLGGAHSMLIQDKWASEILILLTQLIMHGSTNLVDFIVKETEIGKCQGLPLFYVLFYSMFFFTLRKKKRELSYLKP